MSDARDTKREHLLRDASLAIGAILVAEVLRLLLENLLGARLGLFALLYPVLTFVAVIGGLWPGALTTFLGAFITYFYVMPREFPDPSLRLAQRSSTIAFIGVGIALSIFSEVYRKSHAKAVAYDKEEALRASREKLRRYQLFSEHARDIILFVRASDGRILEANDAAVAAYGYSREEMLLRNVYELRADSTMRLTVEQMATADARGILFETVHRRCNGEDFPVEVSSRGADLDGERVLISLIRDITERKRTEEALIRAEKLATVGRIAAAVAHEINNPLEAVTNAVYLANLNLQNPKVARPYLEMADEELKRVSHITRQALGFYRESAVPERVSFRDVVDASINLLSGKIKVKQAQIRRECHGDPIGLVVPGEIRQVFSNLLVNSLDAIEPGGTVRIHISRTICTKTGRRCVRTTVADNGTGIAPETLPRIFEPLFTTKENTGTGLGLWVSKQIVDKHQGLIRARSSVAPGRRGTVVSIVLPVGDANSVQTNVVEPEPVNADASDAPGVA